MLKIAVCDDEESMRQYLKHVIRRTLHVQSDLFASGEELLKSDRGYDILFLDICLNPPEDSYGRSRTGERCKLDGMETARRLKSRASGADTILIFITAMSEYVYDAYDVEAFHYLLKPVNEDKLIEVIQKAAAKANGKKVAAPLVIKVNGAYRNVLKEDIYYAESSGRKIILHTKAGDFSYYEKMEELEQKLGDGFFRSHRGYLVHLKEVASYDRTGITLKSGELVFLAKQKYNDFVAAYMRYLMR